MVQPQPSGGAFPFLSQDEYTFQKLSREVLSHEPDIGNCEIFGTRGQPQKGIDVLASRRSDAKIEVGQCKRYTVLTVSHIEGATRDFFEHWDYWKTQGVCRFILFAASDISSSRLQDAVLRQRAIFRKKKIGYEAWGFNSLQGKLLPWRQVVQNLYGADVADEVCGTAAETPALRAKKQWLDHHLGVVLTELETERSTKLDALRELSREGKHANALREVEAIKAASSWSAFNGKLHARFHRFEAALRLNLKQPPAASVELVRLAREADPLGDFQVIDAYLVYANGSAPEALQLLASPGSIDGWNFRWGLMLESGRGNEIAAEVAKLPSGISGNAETHRVLGIAALLTGDLPRAEIETVRARATGAGHHNVRMLAATVDYFGALVLEAGAPIHLAWPPPIGWAFVRRDPDSVARLRRAADGFARLVDEARVPEERAQMEVFQLAAMACDSERRTETEALVKRLLAENSAHHRVVAWAVDRGLPFDKAAVLSALKAELNQPGSAKPDVCLACCAVLLASKKLKEAEEIVDQAKEAFAQCGALDTWRVQKAQFLAKRGERAQAEELVNAIQDPEQQASAKATLTRVTARTKRDFERLAAEFDAEYRASGSGHCLFRSCELRLRNKDWAYVASHAAELLVKVPTDAALRVALQGSLMHGNYEQCLQLIRDHTGVLHGGELSPDIRVLRAECQQKLGHWQDAITEAEALYRERPTVDRLANYLRLLIETSDVPRCALAARELLQLPGVEAPLFLQAAKITRLHDPALATELWRRAMKILPNDANVMTAALGLAYELGVEHEAGNLQAKLFAQATTKGGGPFQAVTFEDILKIRQEHQDQQEKLNRTYDEAGAPVHLIAHLLGIPLVELYHAKLARNRESSNLVGSPAPLIRYGGRNIPERYVPDEIFADITGLILAADLEILDLVESHLGTIHISSGVTTSLLAQLGKVTSHQPSQHVWRSEMLRLVQAKQIAVAAVPAAPPAIPPTVVAELGEEWAAQWQVAAAANGSLLADFPLQAHDTTFRPVILPPEIAERVFHLRDCLKALYLAGGLTKAEWESAVKARTVVGQQPEREESSLRWPANHTVALTGSIFQTLHAGGWLTAAVANFRLTISAEALKDVEEQEGAYFRQEQLATWTKQLLERIQRGIGQKRYRVIPAQTKPGPDEKDAGPDVTALRRTLNAVGASKIGVFWCDDRAVNRHLMIGSRPVVGIVEILLMLRSKQALSDEEYFNKLLHLRRSNVRYLPPTTEEILHHLRQAAIVKGSLVENPALATLRRYLNSCLLDRHRLLPPQTGGQGNRNDVREWAFAFQLRRAADEALRKVWEQQNDSIETRRAQANWIWRALYVEVLGIRQALEKEAKSGDERDLTAFDVGTMYSLGLTMPLVAPSASDATTAPRKAYYEWITETILLPLDEADPGFIALVARIIGADVIKTTRAALKHKNLKTRRGQCAVMHHLVWNLPNEILQEIDLPAEVMKGIGLSANGPTVTVEGAQFDLFEFWVAQENAINHSTASVKDRAGKREFVFTRQDLPDAIALRVEDTATTEPKIWRESAYPLMLEDVSARVAHLRRHPDWFDCATADREAAIEQIVGFEKPADRVNLFHQWINESPTVVYSALEKKFRGQEGLGIDDLSLPNYRRLCQHLRLDPMTPDPAAALNAMGVLLIKEEGLIAAIRRLSRIPAPLPSAVVEAWTALKSEEAATEWSRLERSAPSPIATLHLVRLGLVRSDIAVASIRALIETFFAQGSEDYFDSFNAVLVWAGKEINRWPESRKLPVWQRLALVWFHAGRLHTIFRVGNAELGALSDWFSTVNTSWNESILAHDADYSDDIANPTEATAGVIAIHGLINICADLLPDRIASLGLDGVWKKLVTENRERAAKIQLELARRTDLARDVFGAVMRHPTREAAEQVFGREQSADMFQENSDSKVVEWIAGVPKDPYAAASWMMLQASIRDLPAAPAWRDALRALLLSFDFKEYTRRDPQWGGVALVFAADHAGRLADAELTARIEAEIIGAARSADLAKLPADSPLPLWLIQAMLPLSIVNKDETATAGNYFARLEKLVLAQPGMAKVLYRAMGLWMASLPFAQQRMFWRLLVTIRAWR